MYYGFYGMLSHLPAWLGLVLLAAIPTAIVVWMHDQFNRRVRPDQLLPHREVAGFLIAVVGVIYAVVLGFAVITVWVQFYDAQQTADREAGDAGELAALAGTFPEPTRTHLRSIIADYAFEVRDREWPMLAYGEHDPRPRKLLLNAMNAVLSMPIPDAASASGVARARWLERDALSLLRDLSVQRRMRLIAAQNHLQGELYLALVIGGLIVMAFVFLFGMENRRLQLVMSALVAGSISVLFAVIIELDRPFSGDVRVSPDAWTLVIQTNNLALYRTRAQP
jgi:hypothetical protein